MSKKGQKQKKKKKRWLGAKWEPNEEAGGT
jgi:hypothetical protein